MAKAPVVQLVEEVICYFDRHELSVCHNNNLLFAIINKVRVIQLIVHGVLLVEVVEVPFNSALVWMLS